MKKKSRKRGRRLFAGAVAIAAVGFYPYSSVVAPAQRIVVMNEKSQPVKGVGVRQSWQHYTLESHSHEEDLTTGTDGRVAFPERRIRACLFARWTYPFGNILNQGVHASFGPDTYIIILGKGEAIRNDTPPIEPLAGEEIYHIKTE